MTWLRSLLASQSRVFFSLPNPRWTTTVGLMCIVYAPRRQLVVKVEHTGPSFCLSYRILCEFQDSKLPAHLYLTPPSDRSIPGTWEVLSRWDGGVLITQERLSVAGNIGHVRQTILITDLDVVHLEADAHSVVRQGVNTSRIAESALVLVGSDFPLMLRHKRQCILDTGVAFRSFEHQLGEILSCHFLLSTTRVKVRLIRRAVRDDCANCEVAVEVVLRFCGCSSRRAVCQSEFAGTNLNTVTIIDTAHRKLHDAVQSVRHRLKCLQDHSEGEHHFRA
mmetsp:Transcript_6145/g.11498  ORF Transcript_6145/g.11498 Transcript_6145/m.11498 type:complete len:278 (+) Transcript_6145:111-944(+)